MMPSETERVVGSLIEGEYTPMITEESELTAGIEQSTIPTIYGYLGTTLKEGAKAYLSTALAVSYSSEYDVFAEGGEEALVTICSFSGGKVTSNTRTLADVEMDTVEISLNPLVLFGIICAVLMILDITIRKIRWKDVKNNLLRLRAKMKKTK